MIYFLNFVTTEHNMQESNGTKHHQQSQYISPSKATNYTDVQQPSSAASYHPRFTSTTTAATRPAQSHSTLPFPSRRTSPSMNLLQSVAFSMNSPNSSGNPHIDLAAFKHSAALPMNTSSSGANANNAYLSIGANPSSVSLSPTNNLPNQNLPTTPYTPLSKHWLWNSSLFYPQTRAMHDTGFLPYPSSLGTFFGNKIRSAAMHTPITNQTPNEHTKSVDLSSSSYCSDINSDSDSLDVSDGKVSPTLNQSTNLKRTLLAAVDANESNAGNTTAKKRNPYSIEELLKKPEKKMRRIEPISFQPSIIIHNNENLPKPSSSPTQPAVDAINDTNDTFLSSDLDDSKSINNNNHITIEVCD